MIHRGKIFENRVRNSGKSISAVARYLSITPRHMYNLFLEKDLDLDTIIKAGRFLPFDFSEDIPEIKNINQKMLNEKAADPDTDYSKCLEEKNKIREDYYTQLAANNELLNKYVSLMENKLMDFASQLKAGS